MEFNRQHHFMISVQVASVQYREANHIVAQRLSQKVAIFTFSMSLIRASVIGKCK